MDNRFRLPVSDPSILFGKVDIVKVDDALGRHRMTITGSPNHASFARRRLCRRQEKRE